jgi:hypothetical protein
MRRAFIMCPREHSKRSSCAGNTGSLTLLFFFILSAAFLPQKIVAQQSGFILFHGVIIDAVTREPLTGAHFIIGNRAAGAADLKGMFSLYAHPYDTITFTCVGYSPYRLVVSDTLRAKEYVTGIWLTTDTVMIPSVVVIPRLGNMRAAIMAEPPAADQQMINAANNLKISAYQGLTGSNELGDPIVNYELLRQKQRYEAYEKGQIPSSQMVALSPLALIPLIYILANGLPEDPEPPVPYISAREMSRLRTLHDSIIYRSPLK